MKNAAIALLTAALLLAVCYIATTHQPEKPMVGAAPEVGESMEGHAHPRSPHWPKVRAEYLEKHPACEACGETKGLQVHHVQQFRLRPDLETDLTNLITLCGPEGHNCHLMIGHSGRFFCENPHVREDAALLLKRIKERKCE